MCNSVLYYCITFCLPNFTKVFVTIPSERQFWSMQMKLNQQDKSRFIFRSAKCLHVFHHMRIFVYWNEMGIDGTQMLIWTFAALVFTSQGVYLESLDMILYSVTAGCNPTIIMNRPGDLSAVSIKDFCLCVHVVESYCTCFWRLTLLFFLVGARIVVSGHILSGIRCRYVWWNFWLG